MLVSGLLVRQLVLGQVFGHGRLEVTDTVAVLVRSRGIVTGGWTGVAGHRHRRLVRSRSRGRLVTQSRVGGLHRCLQSDKIEC